MKSSDKSPSAATFRFQVFLALLFLVIAAGTAGFTALEGFTFVDAFYFSVVTITTVGFGDLHSYDYSVDIQLQENIDVLRFLSVSRLSLINSLVDYRINGGVNVNVGDSSLDFSISNWRTEVDQGQVTSYGIGFTTPLDRASDLELRVAYDDSENFGDTYVFSVYFYTFGS